MFPLSNRSCKIFSAFLWITSERSHLNCLVENTLKDN